MKEVPPLKLPCRAALVEDDKSSPESIAEQQPPMHCRRGLPSPPAALQAIEDNATNAENRFGDFQSEHDETMHRHLVEVDTTEKTADDEQPFPRTSCIERSEVIGDKSGRRMLLGCPELHRSAAPQFLHDHDRIFPRALDHSIQELIGRDEFAGQQIQQDHNEVARVHKPIAGNELASQPILRDCEIVSRDFEQDAGCDESLDRSKRTKRSAARACSADAQRPSGSFENCAIDEACAGTQLRTAIRPCLLGSCNEIMKSKSVNMSIEQNIQIQPRTLLRPPASQTMCIDHAESTSCARESSQGSLLSASCCPPCRRLFCACLVLVGGFRSDESSLLEPDKKVWSEAHHWQEVATSLRDQMQQRDSEIDLLHVEVESLRHEAECMRRKFDECATLVGSARQEVNMLGMQTEDLSGQLGLQQERLVLQRQETSRWQRKSKKRARKLREALRSAKHWQKEALRRHDEAECSCLVAGALNVIVDASLQGEALPSSTSSPRHVYQLPHGEEEDAKSEDMRKVVFGDDCPSGINNGSLDVIACSMPPEHFHVEHIL